MGIFRKIRGAIGNGLVWAGAWVAGKLALLTVSILAAGLPPGMARFLPMILASAAVTGFINGVMFSAVFGLANRRLTLSEILYKALSGERTPSFDTILKVIGALGLRLRTEPERG